MKLSLSWIRDYVNIPEDADLKKLAYDLTMSTVEVEDVEYLAERFENMIVGVIEKIEPHPNADRLRVCKVNIGSDEIKDIVCGGINLEEGMRVAVSCPGAVVRWHGEGEPVVIKNSKLRGVESFGMICASDEIGLGELFPSETEGEILDLSAFDVPAGTSLANALDMNDVLLEIDNKSMTNRPDLWGHYGIAREIAALYNLPLAKIEPFRADVQSDFKVEIEDPDRCTRYIGVEMSGVAVKPAPYKMQNRIWKVGMRPINALVDITNYVMLATGNPTHAFDADNITDHIVVRHAGEGEKLLLLNDKELELNADDLVITDSEGAVALAGVMGGAKDSILPKTERVILEVANFEATGIRRTALRYDTRTEASSRYEKAIDPERCDQALALSMKYFKELYPELQVTGYCDNYVKKLDRAEIDVNLTWLEKRLGKHLTNEEIQGKLEQLGFDVQIDGDNMHVTAPTWRSTGDISIKDDVMEEVARMYGYDNFEATEFTTTFTDSINQKDKSLVRNIKEYLAIRCGMQEVYTYPWMNDVFVNAVLQSTDGVLKLSTPPAPDMSCIRSSLLPNLCEAVAKNERYFNDFSIFEEAQVFFDKNYTNAYDETESLPEQRRHIGAAFASSVKDIGMLFREAKGVLEYMPRYTHMEAYEFKKEEKPVWADNVVWLNIYLDDEKIGDMGLVAKKVSMECGIKNLSVILFEMDASKLKPLKSRTNKFEHLAEYPETDYDISMLFDSDAVWNDIYDAVMGKKKASALLKDASFVDEYRGKQIPQGKKSVTIRLTIGSDEKTLTSQEIESVAEQVMKKLEMKTNTYQDGKINVAIILLKRMSNFTDFDVLEMDSRFNAYYTNNVEEIEKADIILLPGTKNTLADLQSIRANGTAEAIVKAYKNGKKVIGICGGYQMMGVRLEDPEGMEGSLKAVPGLGLLPQITTIEQEKVTKQSHFAFLQEMKGKQPVLSCKGYEIHMGKTETMGDAQPRPVALLEDGRLDGYYLNDRCWGSYLHGILDNPKVLDSLAAGFDTAQGTAHFDYAAFKEEQYDKLADWVRQHSDLDYIYRTAAVSESD